MTAILVFILETLIEALLHGIGINLSGLGTTILILFFSVALFTSISNSGLLGPFRKYLMLGYVFRLILLYIDVYGKSIIILPHSNSDNYTFWYNALSFAETGEISRGGYFSIIMGSYLRLVGENALLLQFLCLLFSMVSLILLVYSLNELQLDQVQISRTLSVVSILPNYAILSIVFNREAIITMMITFSLYFISRWISRKKYINFLIACVFAVLGALFHSGAIMLVASYLIILILYDNIEEKWKPRTSNVIFSIILFFFFFIFLNRTGSTFLNKFTGIESIEDIANTNTKGFSYASYVGNSSSIPNLIVYTIPRYVYFFFSPLPWQWRSFVDIFSFLGSSMFYFIAIFRGIKGFKRGNSQILKVFMAIFFVIGFVFAWGVINTGTAIRHRDKMVMLAAIIWGISLKNYGKISSS